ncbi:monofunctional biosynthetic peptidoglycan transglycosylase [Lysobacteraceae bacterium NML95-0200]|nr:monofunctional biosynthetic peptidoglycan transglycosylase [Xanthomonadaceae bacterium NML95-0200]
MVKLYGGMVGKLQAGKKRLWLRRMLWLPVFALAFPVVQVLALRVIEPPFSSFMLIRQMDAWRAGDWRFRFAYDWRNLQDISPHLPVAVIAAEDQLFAEHRGFDRGAIEKAMQTNQQGKRIRGGSTISQQTAKNLFLWRGSGWSRWLRKALETYYTFWMELFWPKTRILEMYVNVAEFGDGVYGAQAAARAYYRKEAMALQSAEAARMAAVLPNPRRYSIANPGSYVQRRSRAIQRQMGNIGGKAYLEKLQ